MSIDKVEVAVVEKETDSEKTVGPEVGEAAFSKSQADAVAFCEAVAEKEHRERAALALLHSHLRFEVARNTGVNYDPDPSARFLAD